MKQVCIIHGGTTFDTDEAYQAHLATQELDYSRLLYRQRWSQWLGETLTDYDVLTPSFPNSAHAKYDE